MPEEPYDNKPYSNREIREKWVDITNALSRIEIQTTTTNGKVAEINKWRERANGGSVVAGIFMTIIVMPILSWSIYVLMHIDDSIQSSVDDALSAYNLE